MLRTAASPMARLIGSGARRVGRHGTGPGRSRTNAAETLSGTRRFGDGVVPVHYSAPTLRPPHSDRDCCVGYASSRAADCQKARLVARKSSKTTRPLPVPPPQPHAVRPAGPIGAVAGLMSWALGSLLLMWSLGGFVFASAFCGSDWDAPCEQRYVAAWIVIGCAHRDRNVNGNQNRSCPLLRSRRDESRVLVANRCRCRWVVAVDRSGPGL